MEAYPRYGVGFITLDEEWLGLTDWFYTQSQAETFATSKLSESNGYIGAEVYYHKADLDTEDFILSITKEG